MQARNSNVGEVEGIKTLRLRPQRLFECIMEDLIIRFFLTGLHLLPEEEEDLF